MSKRRNSTDKIAPGETRLEAASTLADTAVAQTAEVARTAGPRGRQPGTLSMSTDPPETSALDPADRRALARMVGFVTLSATVLVVLGAIVYTHRASPWLAKLDISVSEVLMREGLRCEAAGALAEAKERYSLALQGRFEGPQNRTDTLKHLGLLYLDEGKLDEAAKNLGEAADSPYAPITVYGPLCDVLLKLERYDETEKTVAVWRKVLEKYPNADALAEANRAAERAQQLRAGHQ